MRTLLPALAGLAALALVAGCGGPDLAAAADVARSWDPGAGFERVDCAAVVPDGADPEQCFTFDEAGALEERVREALESLGAYAGVQVPVDQLVECIAADPGGRAVGCYGTVDYRGAWLQLNADLDPEAWHLDPEQPAQHVLLVRALEP